MNDFQPQRDQDEAFDEREQAEIISLAAALQRDHGQRATLSDLERAAVEAGIEPRFVREAVKRRKQGEIQPVVLASSSDPVESPWRSFLCAALFVPVEYELLSRLSMHMHFGGPFTSFWVTAFALSVIFGLVLTPQRWGRQLALLWPIFVTLLILGFRIPFFSRHLLVDLLLFAVFQGVVGATANYLRAFREESRSHATAWRQIL